MDPPRIDPPLRRPLKIYAFDPLRGRHPLSVLTVDIPNEPGLKRGPEGERLRVVDYDSESDHYYAPIDLDDPALLMQGGLDPSEVDPRFHQQMVYAVAMKVLENFDRALGRRISFRGRPLLLLPHAFRGPNAFYDPQQKSVCFGYFAADENDPGENIPGQPVFSCLSHDIIAHEVTHALVDRLRERFLEPTNVDVMAFHEGFSDIVAIFQHFSFPQVLREAIRESRGDLRSNNELVGLAEQFGHATGRKGALRSAVDDPVPSRYRTVMEPHERGSILVGAVFEGFFETYQSRIQDLLRLATGGTGRLPEGELPPDLVDRLAKEAAAAAQSVLTMCIRAFEYLPPMDVTFGDYLRALITADLDLQGEQGALQRRFMIEAFRRRGIYPEGVTSLSEGALCWPRAPRDLPPMPAGPVAQQLLEDAETLHRRPGRRQSGGAAVTKIHEWAVENAYALGLDPSETTRVHGFHATFRVATSGLLQVEVVVQLTQSQAVDDPLELGSDRLWGGSTIVATAGGHVRFVVAKPLASEERRERQREYVELCDLADPALPWGDDAYRAKRMSAKDFRALHRGLVAI